MAQDPATTDVQQSGAPTSVDYSQFGPMGPQFQQFYMGMWERIREAWELLPEYFEEQGVRAKRLPIVEVLPRYFDRSGWLYERLANLSITGQEMTILQFIQLWEALRSSFNPPLKFGKDITSDKEGLILRTALVETRRWVRMSDPVLLRQKQLNPICYGPWTEQELSYLLQRHHRLIEVGAGSGYFAAQFLQRGGDIIALDNNEYGISGRISPWTRALRDQGKLIVEDDVRHRVRFEADSRTLLISWPEPGSAFPHDVLAAYTQAGGESFALKLGGFIGLSRITNSPNYQPPPNATDNVVRFFKFLAQDWVEEDPNLGCPGWNPELLENNLLVFRRWTKVQQ